ncbi:hypothetical protein AMTRI_Chr01g108910 [Amborella trichopoda]
MFLVFFVVIGACFQAHIFGQDKPPLLKAKKKKRTHSFSQVPRHNCLLLPFRSKWKGFSTQFSLKHLLSQRFIRVMARLLQ